MAYDLSAQRNPHARQGGGIRYSPKNRAPMLSDRADCIPSPAVGVGPGYSAGVGWDQQAEVAVGLRSPGSLWHARGVIRAWRGLRWPSNILRGLVPPNMSSPGWPGSKALRLGAKSNHDIGEGSAVRRTACRNSITVSLSLLVGLRRYNCS